MSDIKKKLWQYLHNGIYIWALMIAGSSLLSFVPGSMAEPVYLRLYFCACFFAGLVLCRVGLEKRVAFLPALLPIIVLLSSRDKLLFFNALYAFLFFCLLYLLSENRFSGHIQRVLTLILLIFWLLQSSMPREVAFCLILLTAAGIAGIFGRDMRYMTILIILAVFASAMVPSSEDPMRWDGVKSVVGKMYAGIKNTWENVSWYFEGFFGGGEATYTGYSETGKLQGSTSANERISLYFETKNKRDKVYLKGAEYAKLGKDGFSERSSDGLSDNAWIALYMSALANGEITKEEAYCFSKLERAKVTYAFLKTKDLIRPEGLVIVSGGAEKETKSKGYTYNVLYLSFDIASPYYKAFTRAAEGATKPAPYLNARAAGKELYNIDLSDYMSQPDYEKAIAQAQEQQQSPVYLDTSMATPRIKELAEELTKDCTTDLERAENIESFLRQYPYDPGTDLRAYDNYVDAFLFEVQKGYCVHYASAMVLLLRLSGVPARYVQGFLYDPANEGTVYGANAHAWVEAYIEGVGWITFEPTAAMQNAAQRTWGRVLRTKDETVPEEIEEIIEAENEEATVPEIPEQKGGTVAVQTEEKTDLKTILFTVGGYVLVILGSLALLILLFLLARRIRYLRLSPEEKLSEDMTALTKRLQTLYPAVDTAGSVLAYLPEVEDENLRDELGELFKGYYRVRFRKDPAEQTLVDAVRKMPKKLSSSRTTP